MCTLGAHTHARKRWSAGPRPMARQSLQGLQLLETLAYFVQTEIATPDIMRACVRACVRVCVRV